MSSIITLVPRPSFLASLLLPLLLIAGCGSSTPNAKSAFNTSTRQHAADWLPAGHMVAAQKDQKTCAECHGSDFQGGISLVSCVQCHLGGAGSVHPLDWTTEQKWTKHAAYSASLGNSGCANALCHGPNLDGVTSSGPSCASCHLDGVDSKHPREWGEHADFFHGVYTLDKGGAKCANVACHGDALTGVVGSGPGCAKCHAAPAHGVLNQYSASCASCHTDEFNILHDTKKMMHPWNAPTTVNHAAYVTSTGNKSCATAACHGTLLTGGANCPSCTSCHVDLDRKHPVSFGTGTAIIAEHQVYVSQNTTGRCANAACHGENLLGGVAGPSCASCHLGGVTTKHPVDFGGSPVLNHKAYVAANGITGCATAACHGTELTGGTAGPSCTSCHIGGPTSKHPASFGTTTTETALNHRDYIALNAVNGKDGMDGCRNTYCHGPSLTGVTGSGPACSQCHQIGSPAALTNCASCHGRPPTGTVYPNRLRAHAVHNAFTGVTNVCDTCHGGAGTGTQNHFSGAVNVNISAAYNAKSGTAVRNSDETCSNVSCHGGQTTPVWSDADAIDVNLDCLMCHSLGTSAGTPENNSYYSGRHQSHTEFHAPLFCGSCHDQTKLAPNHFTSLGTPALEGPASATLRIPDVITSYDATARSCTNSTVGCHPGQTRFW